MTPSTSAGTEYFASRSRSSNFRRCPRARYLLDEAQGHGWSPVRLAVPLVTGGSVHVGLADLLKNFRPSSNETVIDLAVGEALGSYDEVTKGRGFDLADLESQSFVYNEQKALIEALVRMAALRVVPRLLQQYDVLEVEQPDSAILWHEDIHEEPNRVFYPPEGQPEVPSHNQTPLLYSKRITWRSIPDALLRSKSDGDLYLLSWKTVSEFSQKTVDDARIDMQGVSEQWAWEQAWQDRSQAIGGRYERIPGMEPEKIRGVQMVYLVKGSRRSASASAAADQGLTADQIAQGGKVYKTASPLIYGYADQSFPPKLAWASEWRCSGPHGGMRPSKWYPKGECPGQKNHRRGDDWSSFPVWESMGVKAWLSMLNRGEVTPEAGDPLESSWAMPVPFFRTIQQSDRWLRQTRSQERRIARSLDLVRPYEDPEDEVVLSLLEQRLDEEFPQNTENCNRWFGRKCPVWDICHGPDHIARDPLASGLFQIKTPAPHWAEVSDE